MSFFNFCKLLHNNNYSKRILSIILSNIFNFIDIIYWVLYLHVKNGHFTYE